MIYLASSSPRRRVLLKQAGIRYKIVRPRYREVGIKGLGARRLVQRHALGKALSVSIRKGIVLAADTVVVFKNQIIGKPKDIREAVKILKSLQNQWHTVWTGVAIVRMDRARSLQKHVFAEKTRVKIKPMSDLDIRAYFRRVNPLDKAGAYAIQSKHSIIAATKGSFSNAVGLPMEKLKKFLN